MPRGQTPLNSALGQLARLGTELDREQLAAVQERLNAGRLRVILVGEAQRGKSTLINALLGRDVLPTGVTPLTTVVTTLRYGDPHVEVRFADGHDEKHPLGALRDLVSEHGNPGNWRRVVRATAYTDAPVLAYGAELVDTPGTGSVLEWENSEAAQHVLETMDAAVLVMAADPPVSARERDLLRTIADRSMTTFAVLNKADQLDASGLAEVAAFTRRVLGATVGRSITGTRCPGDGNPAGSLAHPGQLYPMSARAAVNSGDPGFSTFAAEFSAYLSGRRMADLTRSAITQARRIATSLLDDVAVARHAAVKQAADVADRVDQFSRRLAEPPFSSRDAVTVVNGESARLLFALNDAADAGAPQLHRRIARQLEGVLDGELRAAPAAEIDRLGRERLAVLTQEAMGAWREQRQADIEQGLAALAARLSADLEAELNNLRDSAAELMNLDLTGPAPGGRLAEPRWLAPASADDAGQAELPAESIHHGIPGEVGRRRARQRVRDKMAALAEREIDRISSDLRRRLAEGTRALARVVEQSCADAAERRQAALQAAADLRDSAAAEARRVEHQLAGREAALRRTLGLLEEAAERELR